MIYNIRGFFQQVFHHIPVDFDTKLSTFIKLNPGPCNGDDDDDSGKFQCSTKRNGIAMCIDAVLMCDGVDNCGDWSDESASACGMC